MKLERRGKYPGVKIHLEPEECSAIVDAAKTLIFPSEEIFSPPSKGEKVFLKLGKMIRKAMKEDSTLLEDRSEEEIRSELEIERDKSIAKLAQMEAGKAWNA